MKVVFIDSWTKGIHNFVPLHAALAERGVESLLLHRGSWGAEPDRPSEEVIDGLRCQDIRRYHGRVYLALRAERPNLVVMLTTNYIADRAVILAARALGIPTTFLMHGIRNVEENQDGSENGVATKRFLRTLRWKRATKYLRYTIPDYFRSGMAADGTFPFRPAPYLILLKTFLKPERQVFHPDPSPELQCDRALVWADVYKDLFVETYGYSEDRVRVVGHPPLDPVFRIAAAPVPEVEQASFLAKHQIPSTRPFTIYLEDSFVETGIEGWTDQARLAHLEEIVQACTDAGRLLVIKLHPGTPAGEIERHFAGDARVRVIQRTDLPRLILLAESVIAHISSTVDIAVSLRKPVLVPRWGISASIPDYFVHRGVATGCDSRDALRVRVGDPLGGMATAADAVRLYVERFITWQDGRSIDRIIESFLEQLEPAHGV